MTQEVTQIFFSPGGTTKKVADTIAEELGQSVHRVNLLAQKNFLGKQFGENDLVVVAMPVFVGRLPAICVRMLKKLKGDNTPAVAVVTYGNRAYEDALLELTDILTKNGFLIAGAGAVVAEHSLFGSIATGRPDGADCKKIKAFAENCLGAIEENRVGTVSVPGHTPYRKISPLPMRPKTNANCVQCGLCAKICPVGAIPRENPKLTDKNKCINCTACVHICPHNAREYRGFVYNMGEKMLKKKTAEKLEPEFFLQKQ